MYKNKKKNVKKQDIYLVRLSVIKKSEVKSIANENEKGKKMLLTTILYFEG